MKNKGNEHLNTAAKRYEALCVLIDLVAGVCKAIVMVVVVMFGWIGVRVMLSRWWPG